eukprot:gb/GECH01013121.1/.p1 GENE.gb/GECH01013121.1/~~gb/GECH01013121.1/.p1  ORF type:complete len:410 (+),score=69.61 gb/GECH01013121.1/:1-1230(+)
MSNFDLEGYISNYRGHTKINRLLFIAEKNSDLAPTAVKTAVDELKNTRNTNLYKQVTEKYSSILDSEHQYDESWANSVDQAAHKELERLELELNSFKTNLIKESIRMGNTELGKFHYDRGNLDNALKCHIRSKDYCTASKHILNMCLSVITVAIETNNFTLVNQFVNKGQQVPENSDPVIQGQLSAAAGLAALANKKYKDAAKRFIGTHFELGNAFNHVIAAPDVAVYGALCALATYDRQDLYSKCMNDGNFKHFLELAPSVRELLNGFHQGNYSPFLQNLNSLKEELQYDIFLHEHLDNLCKKIYDRALTQYASPFTSVDMYRMADTFNTDVETLEKDVAKLIMENQIQARIDSHNKRMYARQVDERSVTFNKVMDVGDTFVSDTQNQLLKMNLLQNDFVVRAPRSSK